MTSMLDPVLDLEPDLDVSWDAELGLLGLLGTGGSAGLVAGVADPGLPVPLGLATGLLSDVDPYAFDGDARVDLIRGLERCRAMLDAVQQRAIAAVAEATEGLGRPGEEARHEVGAALRLCPGTAAGRLEVARELVGRLPAVQAALQAGLIGYLQAAAIAAGVRDLPDELAVPVADRVLRTAPDQTVAETKRAVARAVATVDPAAAADRHQKATADAHDRAAAAAGRDGVDLVHDAGPGVQGPVGDPDRRRQGRPGRPATGRAALPRAERAAGRRPGARRAGQRRRRPATTRP